MWEVIGIVLRIKLAYIVWLEKEKKIKRKTTNKASFFKCMYRKICDIFYYLYFIICVSWAERDNQSLNCVELTTCMRKEFLSPKLCGACVCIASRPGERGTGSGGPHWEWNETVCFFLSVAPIIIPSTNYIYIHTQYIRYSAKAYCKGTVIVSSYCFVADLIRLITRSWQRQRMI